MEGFLMKIKMIGYLIRENDGLCRWIFISISDFQGIFCILHLLNYYMFFIRNQFIITQASWKQTR